MRSTSKSSRVKSSRLRRLLPVLLILWVTVMGAYVYFFVFGNLPGASSLTPLAHTHVKFQVFINGQNLTTTLIPGGIGQNPDLWQNHTLDSYGQPGIAPLYTESADGIIHIVPYKYDAKVPNGFVLEDFFNIWGKILNQYCIELDKLYCTDTYAISTFIDDPQNPDPVTISAPDPSAHLRGTNALQGTTLIRVKIASLSSPGS